MDPDTNRSASAIFDKTVAKAIGDIFAGMNPNLVAECFLSHVVSSKIQIRNQQLENLVDRQQAGFGLRIIDSSGKTGFYASSNVSVQGIAESYHQALELLSFAEADSNRYLYQPKDSETNGYLQTDFDQQIMQAGNGYLIDIGFKVEQNAKNFNSLIVNFEQTSVSRSLAHTWICNSLGLDKSYDNSFCSVATLPVAESKSGSERQVGYAFDFAKSFSSLEYQQSGQLAALNAINKLGAKSIETGRYPVVLDQQSSAALVSVLAQSFYGENIVKRKSLFCDSLQNKIASSKVCLVNEAEQKQSVDYVPIDDEGLPVQNTMIIEDGVLQSYLHNLYSSRAMKLPLTASANRGYSSIPSVAASNCYLRPEHGISAEDVLNSVKKGIYVEDMLGLHTINQISGDFSIGVSGRYICNGKLSHAISGMAIAGNIRDLLFALELVADDLKIFPGGFGGSTILLKDLTVSGG